MLRTIKTHLFLLCICLACVSFSWAAKIYLAPESEHLISNCDNNIDIMIDTQWEDIFWAATTMQYDWKNIQIDGFYINEAFNLPRNVEIDGLWNIKSAALSMIKDANDKQTWFSGSVKYATLVIKNKEPITTTQINFLFSWQGNTTDNMDVFRLSDAQDVLTSVTWGIFSFVDGQCLHQSPEGINQTDPNYDYQSHINGNLANIAKLEKQMVYKQRIKNNINIISYVLIFLLIIILILIMWKKWLLNDIHLPILKNKKNENA